MTTYSTSSGERVKKSTIDYRVREAKRIKLSNQIEKFGYNFCEKCNRNDDTPIDCSHIESVDSCQKNGRAEKCCDLDNISILGRKCHSEFDKNDVRWKN